MKKIVLIGAGGHCKVIIDIIKSKNNYEIVGVTDKNEVTDKVLDIPIIGDDSILEKLHNNGIEYAFICIGALDNLQLRNIIYNKLKKIGFKLPVLIHKDAVVSKYAHVEAGTCIMPGAIINAGAAIKENCIVNTGAIIEHDCIIGKNTHVSPKACIAGASTVGNNCHVGMGSSVIQCVKIGDNVTIGAGAVVIDDIDNNSLAVGVPARVIKTKDVI